MSRMRHSMNQVREGSAVRLTDTMKPAMEWAEAAMLPARVRTISGGAALKALPDTALACGEAITEPLDAKVPAAAAAPVMAKRTLQRAAYRQIRHF